MKIQVKVWWKIISEYACTRWILNQKFLEKERGFKRMNFISYIIDSSLLAEWSFAQLCHLSLDILYRGKAHSIRSFSEDRGDPRSHRH